MSTEKSTEAVEAVELSKQKASEVDLFKEYNLMVKEIPWDNLKVLPEKLAKVGKLIPGFSFNHEDVDIITPLRRIVTYVGVLVKRLRTSEKKSEKMETCLQKLEERLQKLEENNV